jgi:outer membrane immunogenic protein
MHRIALIGAGLLSIAGLAGAASAADLPARSPAAIPAAIPPDPVQFSWSGCYVGGHVGGVLSRDTTTSAISGTSRSYSSSGFVGGGQVGCDYQFAPAWVVGIEGRAAWTSLKNIHASTVTSLTTGIVVPSQFTVRNDFLASATARLGYSFVDRWLVFARGGAAWTHEKTDEAYVSSVLGVPVDPSVTLNRTGWTAGAGVEWAFAPHWSASAEYNYYDFGNLGLTLRTPTNNVFVIVGGLKDTIHAVTASLNYRF